MATLRSFGLSGFFLLLLSNAFADQLKDNIVFKEYHLNSDSCYVLKYFTGSLIYVPSHPFKNLNDEEKYYTLRYREIRTPSEIISTNLPMYYTENNKRYLLESSGMFELNASSGDKNLVLNAGKKIQVRMAADNNLDKLNAYLLDTINNEWLLQKQSVVDVSVPMDKITNLSTEEVVFLNDDGSITVPTDIVEYNNEYNRYYDSINKANQKVYKAMNIDKMGIYNYDELYHNEDKVFITADFKMKDSPDSIKSDVFVIYDGINTVIKYTHYDFTHNFYLLPRSDLRIFSILPNGKVAVLHRKPFVTSEIKGLAYKKVSFELEQSRNPVLNNTDLASATGIK